MKNIYLLSDSSGNLLEHFFNAILTQFPKKGLQVHAFPFLKDPVAVSELLDDIEPGIIFHAVAATELKELIAQLCQQRKMLCFDVTGPTVDFLEQATGLKRYSPPRPVHATDTDYMNRMKVLEFAMQHDDGRRIEDLDKAEIILVGISRVSKSPTSFFLAYRGFKVANVSIVPGTELPGCLGQHQHTNVVAFTMQPKKLAEIRERRFANWDIDEFKYHDKSEVIREVMEAEKIYKAKSWPIIDTTHLAVEETSSLVLHKLKLKPKVFETAETVISEPRQIPPKTKTKHARRSV